MLRLASSRPAPSGPLGVLAGPLSMAVAVSGFWLIAAAGSAWAAGEDASAPAAQAPGEQASVATDSVAPATDSVAPATSSTVVPDDSPRIRVGDIRIEGNRRVSDEQILLALPVHRGEEVSRKQVVDALQRVYGLGLFRDVNAGLEDAEGGQQRLVVRVVENPVLDEVRIEGMTLLPVDEALAAFQPLKGRILNMRDVQKRIKDLEKRYADQGYVLARVYDMQVQDGGVLALKVAEGIVQAIRITGNEDTQEYVIRRELTVKPGEVFNFKRMEDDLRRLYNLNYFEDLGLRYEPGETPQKVIIVVNVKEKQTGIFQASAGFSSRDGLIGMLSFRKENLLGRGQTMSVDVSVSQNPFGEISYFNPWFTEQKASFGTQAYYRRYFNVFNVAVPGGQGSQDDRQGGSLSFGVPLGDNPVTARWRVSGTVKGERVQISRQVPAEARWVASRADSVSGNDFDLAGSVGATLTHDSRDFVLNPNRGVLSSVTAEYYLGALGLGQVDVLKLQGDWNVYLPAWPERTVLAMGFKGATTLAGPSGKVPIYERFYSMGPYLVRGWAENVFDASAGRPSSAFQGDSLALGAIEYRFPIWNILSGVLFGDTGLFWDQTPIRLADGSESYRSAAFKWENTRSGYGFGFRLITPFGPLRLDLGIRSWDPAQQAFPTIIPQFSIGQKF
ncbi:MAG: BamA/TamA family outer membrane protein [Candidatus Sericytochromatia bacterium]|nr:BamA/TamA family outer membrane protein [Candidatus Sericytochromatia bacterium]